MSRDHYQPDRQKHGGLHVDRYSPQGKSVGRYRPDKTTIKHCGKLAVPAADSEKFARASKKCQRQSRYKKSSGKSTMCLKKRIVKFRTLPKFRIPAVIPPRSVVILATVDSTQVPGWLGDCGRISRIGFYRPQDGVECIWLLNSQGKYEQTVDRTALLDPAIVLKPSNESDLFGTQSSVEADRAG